MSKEIETLLTHERIAMRAAIETGLCPEIDAGIYCTYSFRKFWDKYQADAEKYRATLTPELRVEFNKNRD